MGTENSGFRSAVFGGFNRKDVLSFFERFSRESNEKITDLTAELRRLEEVNIALSKEKAALTEEMNLLRGENGGRIEAEEKLQASLLQKNEELAKAAEALEDAGAKLADANKEVAELRKQVALLEPQAKRYEMLKDRVATVELEAHHKAENIIETAKKEESALRAETAALMSEVGQHYDVLRNQVRENAVAAAKAESMFAALEGNYEELMRKGLGERK